MILVYMTAPSRAEAERIGRILVEERLAACVNILGETGSIFRWDGEIRSETETAFLAKTTRDMLDRLTETVRREHPYDVPCVIALPVVGGNPDFIAWVKEECGPAWG